MGDDIGCSISARDNSGTMLDATPNLDKLATQRMLCLAKIERALEINNIKKRDVTMLHAVGLGEITIRYR